MSKSSALANLRKDYQKASLTQANMLANPFTQFQQWLEVALQSSILEATAMVVATVDVQANPSARMVLLKAYDERGFIFYTNYDSRKGRALSETKKAALLFYWDVLERQIRIEGEVEKVDAETATNYFQSRPRGSQIGAWASPQSTTIDSRTVLEENLTHYTTKFEHQITIDKPPHWGGFRVKPHLFEFWQGRSNRLHDRMQYRLTENGIWQLERLAP